MRPSLHLSTFLAIAMLAACATAPPTRLGSTIDHVPTMTLPDGHVAVLVRSFEDEVKLPDGTEERRRVEYLWDYSAGIARERHLTMAGAVLSDETLPFVTMHAIEAELDFAVTLLRANPEIDARFTADTDIYGGFAFREPGHAICDAGSRCIHVIVSRDQGRFKVAHAIVDLQTARVVDDDYDPDLGGIAEFKKESKQKAAN